MIAMKYEREKFNSANMFEKSRDAISKTHSY